MPIKLIQSVNPMNRCDYSFYLKTFMSKVFLSLHTFFVKYYNVASLFFLDQDDRAVRFPRVLRRPRVDPHGAGRELWSGADQHHHGDQGQAGRREQPVSGRGLLRRGSVRHEEAECD